QNINLNSDLTFYVLHGDYLARLGSSLAVGGIVFLVIAWFYARRRRKKISTTGS
ncbi:MAG: LPXTG cell wall anchor domain-containing protein, partial [Bacteroidetes bacterium]|nr:LPXTG cell wall anchor domain-containing protein [Bacteroidota bacterium]